MYGLGTFFAIRNAIKAFNIKAECGFSAPMTPEKVLMALYSKSSDQLLLKNDLKVFEAV